MTMDGKGSRGLTAAASQRSRHSLTALLFLGVLLLPILAYVIGAPAVIGPDAGTGTYRFLESQALLVLTALVAVVGVGGFLIWSTATSVARTSEVENGLGDLDETLARRLEQNSPLVNSFTRMLNTIERQGNEITHFAKQLDAVYRELESANARLQEVSSADELTRLHNRRSFSLRLEEEIGRYMRFGHPLSLVLVDLDGFKAINDELGHQAGDETLREVALLLKRNSRSVDLIFRYGGDEFAILLVETDRGGAVPYSERLREILPLSSFDHGRAVTASIGIATLPEDGPAAEDLVRVAEEALGAAKRAGRNCVAVGARRPAAPEVRVA